jgi:hypothetical protein
MSAGLPEWWGARHSERMGNTPTSTCASPPDHQGRVQGRRWPPVGHENPDSHREQGLRSIRRCCSCSRLSSARSPACWPCRTPMPPPRTWRSWCSGINFECCAVRPAVPGSPPWTACCSPPPVGSCPGTGGHRFWSPRRRCCAGTANSSDASGPTARRVPAGDHQSTLRSPRWSFGSPGRTLDGAASGSAENSASSASVWARPPSGPCCGATGWVPRHDARDRHGPASCEHRPRGSWRVTCSR